MYSDLQISPEGLSLEASTDGAAFGQAAGGPQFDHAPWPGPLPVKLWLEIATMSALPPSRFASPDPAALFDALWSLRQVNRPFRDLAVQALREHPRADVRFEHLRVLARDPRAGGLSEACARFEARFPAAWALQRTQLLADVKRGLVAAARDLTMSERALAQHLDRTINHCPWPGLDASGWAGVVRTAVAERIAALNDAPMDDTTFRTRVTLMVGCSHHVGVRFHELAQERRDVVFDVLRNATWLKTFKGHYHEATAGGECAHGTDGLPYLFKYGLTPELRDGLTDALRARNPGVEVQWNQVAFDGG